MDNHKGIFYRKRHHTPQTTQWEEGKAKSYLQDIELIIPSTQERVMTPYPKLHHSYHKDTSPMYKTMSTQEILDSYNFLQKHHLAVSVHDFPKVLECKHEIPSIKRVLGWAGVTPLYSYTDSGAVEVYNNSFSAMFSNGYGDGKTWVVIIEGKDDHEVKAIARGYTRFQGSVQGSFNIAEYSGTPLISLQGRYGVYSGQGVVFFEHWD